MQRIVFIIALAFWLPCVATAQQMVPMVDLRNPAPPPLLSTWAHAGGKAAVQLEAPDALDLICDIYQVNGKSVIALARGVALNPLTPGANLLEIQLPEKSERGQLLFKIASTADAKLVANLMVDILPKDAWTSLSKYAKDGKLSIDPTLKIFENWAASKGISGTRPTPEKPVEYYFGKPAGNSDSPPPGRFVIYERDAPDAFPVIEVLSFPAVTKIILPPGFLAKLPQSAPAQALLLKYLKLLP